MRTRRRIVVGADWYSQLMLTVIAVSCAAIAWRLCGPQFVSDNRLVIFNPAPLPVNVAGQGPPLRVVGDTADQTIPIRLFGLGRYGRIGRTIPVEVENTIDVNVENDALSVWVENGPLSVEIQ